MIAQIIGMLPPSRPSSGNCLFMSGVLVSCNENLSLPVQTSQVQLLPKRSSAALRSSFEIGKTSEGGVNDCANSPAGLEPLAGLTSQNKEWFA